MAKRKSIKGQTTIYKNCTQKSKDRATRTPLKTGGELMCSRRVQQLDQNEEKIGKCLRQVGHGRGHL